MFKILFLVGAVSTMVIAQCFFIYNIGNGGADYFLNVWHSFNIDQDNYSKFVFSTIKVWWALPIICTLGLAISLYFSIKKLAFLTFTFTFLGTIALYWSAYAPGLMIKI